MLLPLQIHTRAKKILKQLSRTQLFKGLEIPATSPLRRSREEKDGIFKSRKK